MMKTISKQEQNLFQTTHKKFKNKKAKKEKKNKAKIKMLTMQTTIQKIRGKNLKNRQRKCSSKN